MPNLPLSQAQGHIKHKEPSPAWHFGNQMGLVGRGGGNCWCQVLNRASLQDSTELPGTGEATGLTVPHTSAVHKMTTLHFKRFIA